MLRITFYGGFHHSEEISINIRNEKAVERITSDESHPLDELSDYQRKKLNRHFCGIKGCTCEGVIRASYYYSTGKPF